MSRVSGYFVYTDCVTRHLLRRRDVEVGWPAYIVAGAAGIFTVLRAWYWLPRFSDGNVYLYTAWALHSGVHLYTDVFYSSPPLLPYLYYAWGIIFGYTWQALNGVPLLTSLLDTGLLYIVVRRRAAASAAAFAAVIYLLSFTVLATTDFVSDVHVMTTLLLAAWLLFEQRHPVVCGVLLGLACLTKVYAVVPAAGFVLALLAVRGPRAAAAAQLAAGLLFVVGGGLLPFYVQRGPVLYDMLITSHLGQIAGLSRAAIWRFFVWHDPLLVLAAAIVLVLLWRGRRFPSAAWWWVPVCLAIFLVFYRDIYFLYFKMLAVWLAAWAGWSFWQLRRLPHRVAAAGFVLVIVLIGGGVFRYVRDQAEVAAIDRLEEIAAYVEQNTELNEPIFGTFEVAPLVALEAGRPLWRHQADTNVKFFQTGYFDLAQHGQALAADGVRLILVKTTIVPDGRMVGGFEQIAPFDLFADSCRVDRVFPIEKDYSSNAVAAWICNE